MNVMVLINIVYRSCFRRRILIWVILVNLDYEKDSHQYCEYIDGLYCIVVLIVLVQNNVQLIR